MVLFFFPDSTIMRERRRERADISRQPRRTLDPMDLNALTSHVEVVRQETVQ